MPVNGVIYSIVSHTSSNAEKQYTALAKYAPMFRPIFVEDTTHPCIPKLTYPKLCVTLPFARGSSVVRSARIATYIFKHIVPNQKERYAVVIHGDMFPMYLLDAVALFNKQRFVVVGQRKKDSKYGWFTQLLGLDTTYGIDFDWERWPVEHCNILPCRKVRVEGGKHYEIIGDCWHHTTRISQQYMDAPVAQNKNKMLELRKNKKKPKKCGSCGKKHTKDTVKKALKNSSKRKELNLRKLRNKLS